MTKVAAKNTVNSVEVRKILETGVMSVVLYVDGTPTDYFAALEEAVELDADYSKGVAHGAYARSVLLPIMNDRLDVKLLVFCKNGLITYRLIKYAGENVAAYLESMIKGPAMYSPSLDRSALPHRFRETRFVGLATTDYDNIIGTHGNKEVQSDFFADSVKETEFRVVVIGRHMFEQIGGAKALPNRMIMVVSAEEGYRPEGAFVIKSPNDLIDKMLTKFLTVERVYIIGGSMTFNTFLPLITDWRIVRHNVRNSDPKNKNRYMHLPMLNPVDWYASGSRNYLNKVTGAYARIQNLRLRKADIAIVDEGAIDDEEKVD